MLGIGPTTSKTTKHIQNINQSISELSSKNTIHPPPPTTHLTTITQNNQHQIDSDSANYSAPEMKSRPQTRGRIKKVLIRR